MKVLTVARAVPGIPAWLVGFCVLASCGHEGAKIDLEMYDGWRMVGRERVSVPLTTVVVSVLDEGLPSVVDDETLTLFTFEVPDEDLGPLPLTLHNVRGTQESVGLDPPSSAASFEGGSITFEKAVPGGFLVAFNLGTGTDRVAGRATLRPVGDIRRDLWPYGPQAPARSWSQRMVQVAKDAWAGAT